jgi:hypothetical protein
VAALLRGDRVLELPVLDKRIVALDLHAVERAIPVAGREGGPQPRRGVHMAMPHSALWAGHSGAQRGTARHSAAQSSTAQHSTAQHSAAVTTTTHTHAPVEVALDVGLARASHVKVDHKQRGRGLLVLVGHLHFLRPAACAHAPQHWFTRRVANWR